MMSSLTRDMVFLILQFLKEQNLGETAHELEKESGFFFDMGYFENAVTNGEWDEVEDYLLGFTKVDDNRCSMKIFFEIRKQKYLEAMDKENNQLSEYGDTESARKIQIVELKKLIQTNPVFRDKLEFPTLMNSRLRILVNQSLNWQHQLCRNPWIYPDIKTLFVNHTCDKANGDQAQSPAAHLGTSRNALVPSAAFLDGSMAHQASSPSNAAGDGHSNSSYTVDDLPKTVAANLIQDSAVKSMDFHPLQQTVLVVGTYSGDVSVWEVGTKERLVLKPFHVWNLRDCTTTLQASLQREYTASIKRVRWSAGGCLLGVAYSKHIFHLYAYTSGDDLRNHLEIDAHVGSVNDLAFSRPKGHLCVITCGEDKKIRVWDAATGANQHTLEGREAPVYSVCPHFKDNIQFVLATATDGKIRAWTYGDLGSRDDFVAPGRGCTILAYTADGKRLFSCGTNKKGESHMVEWNEREGVVKRKYAGLGKGSFGVLQFDTTRNRFLAVGDECAVKYWDMENVNLLSTVVADGGLELSPCIRFNKKGILLAVSTIQNGVKILANAEGAQLIENRARSVSKEITDDDLSISEKTNEITQQSQLHSLNRTYLCDDFPSSSFGVA